MYEQRSYSTYSSIWDNVCHTLAIRWQGYLQTWMVTSRGILFLLKLQVKTCNGELSHN
jgi:hypothetical protein